jgi:hypothetical protein
MKRHPNSYFVTEPEVAGRRSPTSYALWGAGVVVVCHFFAMLFPSAKNWGFNQFGFFPAPTKVTFLLFMTVALIPVVNRRIYYAVLEGITWFQTRPRWFSLVLVVVSLPTCAVLFWIARERFFLLGDGTLLPRTLPFIRDKSNFIVYSHYEPLAGYFNWKAFNLFQRWGILLSNELPIQVANVLFGMGCVAALATLAKSLSQKGIDRFLIFSFVASCGGTALWFGYVENYTSVYLGLILYVWASVKFVNGDYHVAVPAFFFGILVILHFGMISMVPSFGYLLLIELQRKRAIHAAASLAVACATMYLLLAFLGYDLEFLWRTLIGSSRHLLGVSDIRNEFQHYTFFSLNHLIDYLNSQLMIAPLALPMLLVAILFHRSRSIRENPTLIFLLIVALCGITFTLIFNFDFGMARDWDLQVPFNLGLIVAGAYAWTCIPREKTMLQTSLVVMILVSLIHTISWIGITSNEDRGIARFQVLADSTMWGKRTLIAAYEESAIYFRDRGNYQRSLENYSRFLDLEPGNPRIMMAIATDYNLMGDKLDEEKYMELAVNSGLKDVKILRHVAGTYTKRGEFERSIELCKRILGLDSSAIDIWNSVGGYYRDEEHDYTTALPYFLHALRIDPTSALTYLNAGLCYQSMKKPLEARLCLERSLRLDPQGPYAEFTRKALQTNQ